MYHGTTALLQRSLRADAKKRGPHAIRIASVLLILIMLVAAHIEGSPFSAPGLVFFRNMSLLGVVLITLAGLGHFVTAITEEREEGTLGLLLLADLSPFSILLGKSTNRILSAWLVFAAQFPFALLALTLGGITVTQIAATYIALAMYLFLVANLALFASACSHRSTQAVLIAVLLLFTVLGAIPALHYYGQILASRAQLPPGWMITFDTLLQLHEGWSILNRLEDVQQLRYSGGLWSAQATGSLIIGCLAFLCAWIVFRRVIWDADVTAPPRLEPVHHSKSRWLQLVSRPRSAPIIWKDFHFLAGGFTVWGLKLLLIPLLGLLFWWKTDWCHEFMYLSPWQTLQLSLFLIAGGELLFASSLLFHIERKEGTLANLLLLPHSIASISYSKITGCLLGVAPTLAVALLLAFLHGDLSSAEKTFFSPAMVLGVGLFLVLCHLTVLCSLFVKWGSLALATGLLCIIGSVVFSVAGTMLLLIREGNFHQSVQVAPCYYVTIVTCAALQVAILLRLESISGN
ncbi:MAG: ABC transporter permease [Planctomycetaceae bacterium]|nr:ABC transporter permease [Planctomycetaceae bacterium]